MRARRGSCCCPDQPTGGCTDYRARGSGETLDRSSRGSERCPKRRTRRGAIAFGGRCTDDRSGCCRCEWQRRDVRVELFGRGSEEGDAGHA